MYENSEGKYNITNRCVHLPIYGDNNTFCGVTREWTPRFSFWIMFAIFFALAALSLVTSAYIVKKIWNLVEIGKIARIILVGKVIYDAIDVLVDSFLFLQLEHGNVMQKHVYLNEKVNNSILAFAILGALKILMWIPVYSFTEYNYFGRAFRRADPDVAKRFMVAIAFLAEDGPELFLEYFYVEKFFTSQSAWYLIMKDFFTVFIAVVFIFMDIKTLWESRSSSVFMLCMFNACVGCLEAIRVCAAFYQYYTKRLYRSCFGVVNGALVQTPFTEGCLREVDYAILVLLGLIGGMTFYLLCFFIHKTRNPMRYININ